MNWDLDMMSWPGFEMINSRAIEIENNIYLEGVSEKSSTSWKWQVK